MRGNTFFDDLKDREPADDVPRLREDLDERLRGVYLRRRGRGGGG